MVVEDQRDRENCHHLHRKAVHLQSRFITMSASESIEIAKQRLRLAEKFAYSAEQSLKAAGSQVQTATLALQSAKSQFKLAKYQVKSSENEVEKARKNLNDLEEKYEVIDVDSESTDDASLQISVKTLTGKTITLDVKSSTKISKVKALIEKKEGFPRHVQHLYYCQKDTRVLSHYNVSSRLFISLFTSFNALTLFQISNESSLSLMLRFTGL